MNVKRSIRQTKARAFARWPNLSFFAFPIAVAIVMTIASLVVYQFTQLNLEASWGRSIDRRQRENQQKVKTSLDSYAHVLWGGAGRVNSAPIDEESWQQFMAAFDLKSNFRGMEAIGLIRTDESERALVTYVSPKTDITARTIGYDLMQSPLLAAIMNKAVQENTTVLSDVLPGVFAKQGNTKSQEGAFLMFVPYYNQSLPLATTTDRHQAVGGYVTAMFSGDIFFNEIFKDSDWSHAKMTIHLGKVSPSTIIYEKGANTTADVQQTTQEIDFYKQKFIFTYSLDREQILVPAQTYLPKILLYSGLVLGAVFALVAWYFLRHRFLRLAYEKERDVEFAKDELLSLASHQLRTPATGVKQYLGMVLQGFSGKITPKQREYLERAYANNDRQLQIINDILHLAKINAGRIVLSKRSFNLAEMVREIIDEQMPEAEKGEITLLEQTPPKAMIQGDSHMIRMVIENLASNAIKYTPPGGKVTIRLTSRGNRYIIAVKDTGVGIAKSDFSKLFQQFSRITNPMSDLVTGTGVGLYLAHHLTVLHGGTVSVKSIVGKGSIFTVRLPK